MIRHTVYLSLILYMISMLFVIVPLESASPPQYINYQGVLRGATGSPLTGSFNMIFWFYNAETAGDLLLTDTHSTWDPVDVSNGLFDVDLGSGIITPGIESDIASVFQNHAPVYMEVQVETEVLSPRILVVSSAYSLNADHLDGFDGTSFSLTGHDHDDLYYTETELQTSGSSLVHWDNLTSVPLGFADGTDDGIITETDPLFGSSPAFGIGTGDINNWNTAHGWGDHSTAGYDTSEDSWTSSGIVSSVTGNVGIGTTTPIERLEVIGNIKLDGFIYNTMREIEIASYTSTNLTYPSWVCVDGNYAYVTSTLSDNLAIFDVSNPHNMVARDFTDTNMDYPECVCVVGDYAYVVSRDNDTLAIFNISDPDNIIPRGSTSAYLNSPKSVCVVNDYAYVANSSGSRLLIFDVSDPDNIVIKNPSFMPVYSANAVAVVNNYAYATCDTFDSLVIYNVSDPENIIIEDVISDNLSSPCAVTVLGDYAYVADCGNSRLAIFDISDPGNIIAKGYTTENLSQPYSVAVAGNIAYLTSFYTNSLVLFNVSNPENIVFMNTISTEMSNPVSVDIEGNYAYVASFMNNRLVSFNNANPIGELEFINGTVFSGYSLDAKDGDPTEALFVDDDGDVGIGTINPGRKLDVAGDINLNSRLLFDSADAFTGNSAIIGLNAGSGKNLLFYAYDAADEIMTLDGDTGYVSIGTTTPSHLLFVNGEPANPSWSTWTTTSDRRLKDIFGPYDRGLDEICQLHPMKYRYKESNALNLKVDSERVGLIAQDVRQVFPEAVTENSDGYLFLNNDPIFMAILTAIKELKQSLSNSNELLQTQLNTAVDVSSTINHDNSDKLTGVFQKGASLIQHIDHYPLISISLSENVKRGDVIVVDQLNSGLFRTCSSAADPGVIGVVVDELEQSLDGFWHALVASSGMIVSCNVDTRYGPISVGDLLTTSATPGHAMKSYEHITGTIIGKALEPLEAGVATINILVMPN